MNDILDDILYEDKEMILLHKPGGIAVQTARLGQKDLVSMLKNYRAGKNEDPYIGVVHRLDQPVEGVILFAKTKEAAASFSRQFQSHQTDKCYCGFDGLSDQGSKIEYFQSGKTGQSWREKSGT